MSSFNKIYYIRYILYALAVLPIFIYRDFTPDNELRYLSIADEALRNGSIFTFTNHGIVYADKPPLYLWIVMLGKLIFGYHNMLFLGIFSFLPALVVIYVMDQWVKNLLSERERLAGQLMLLTSGFFIGSAIVLRMDMLMCMFIVLALYTFFRMYSGVSKPPDTILFPLFVFMAIFSKGPIGLIVPLVSTIIFLLMKRNFRTIRRYWGWKTLLVLLILSLAWFTGVYFEGGSQYLKNLLFNQTVNRAVNSIHHNEPFYFYILSIWYSIAPWSLLFIGILIAGLKKRLVSTDLELFFLVVALSTFVTLSLFSSKLAVYILPAIPFFAYIAILWISRLGSPKWLLPLIGIPALILCLALPGVIIARKFISIGEISLSPILLSAILILSATGIFALRYLFNHKPIHGIITTGAGMLLAVFAFSFSIPKYNAIIGLGELCSHAKKTATEKAIDNFYYCQMRKGDNLDVYLGVKLEKLRKKELFDLTRIKKPAILFLWDKALERNDSLKTFIKGKNIHQSGNYYCVEIE